MRPVQVTVGPLASASANAICLSQTPTAAFTLNGALVISGVAIMDTPRRVLFTAASDESAKTITVVGTDWNNASITEVVPGPNATTGYTKLDFKTVTLITISAAAAGAFTVGTNGVASSMWVRFDEYAPALAAVQCIISGTVNYTVQQTLQDPNSAANPVNPYQVTFANSADSNVVSATSSAMSYFAYAPIFAKVTLNSGSGSVTAIFSQNGVAPY